MSRIDALKTSLFQRVDISSIVFFRIAFGAVMLWEVLRYFQHDWIRSHWIDPEFHFTYGGFHWLQPWSGNGMYVHFFGLGVLAIGIMLGLWYRWCTLLFFPAFTYVYLLEKSYYLNHFYLIILLSFLLIFIPAHRAGSLDARLNPEIESASLPAWMLWLLRFQIAVPYFFGGVAKVNADWLAGEPMRMWLAARTDFPVIGSYFTEEWMVYFFSYGGLLLDLLIVPFLLWKRTRLAAFLVIASFHLMNAWLWRIGIFPWFMIAATTIFFEPDWFRRTLNYFSFIKLRLPAVPVTVRPAAASSRIALLLSAYFLIQVWLPFRHHLFSGDVSWNELGHRYAWHMKLRSKNGKAIFHVTDLDTGKEWKVNPREYLSSRQRRKMATHPDMILQFSRFLEQKLAVQGYDHVAIRADVKVRLNGREWQPMIDPEVDLLQVSAFTSAKEWILPLEEPLRKEKDKSQK